jgi:type I restriction enzyme S subunit
MIVPAGWKEICLGDLGTFSKGAGIKKDQVLSEGFPCIRYGQIYTEHDSWVKKIDTFVSKEVACLSRQLQKGEILFAGSGETKADIGKCVAFIDDGHTVAGGDIVILTPDRDDSKFLGYALNASYVAAQKMSRAQGDAVVHISASSLSSVLLLLPPLKEQKAIAEALSDVDALIDSLEALLTKKRNIKTGVMQELLTGRTRLPGFTGNWHEVCLEDFADCFDHLRIPLNESERLTRVGDYPYCGANGVLGFIDEYLIDDEMVLIAEDGGYFDEFATRPIAYKMSGKYWVNNHAHVLKAKPSQDNNYLYYSLVHKDVTPYLASGTRAKLNKSEMWKIEIRAPKSKKEQEAIANVLSDIDEEIDALEKRLGKTRDLKQGMAQELLTGRTRLV